MDLNEFLGARPTKTAPPVASPPWRQEPHQSNADPVPRTSGPATHLAQVPEGTGGAVIRDVTPNGTVVEYESEPKRLYRVNGVEVPSVTTVLDVLNKGGLTVWGWRVGIDGVLQLFDRGRLCTAFDWEADRERVAIVEGEYATAESVEAILKEEKLTTTDAKDSAADRGDIVHKALEEWAKTGRIPNPDDFAEREKGYVEGLVKFLQDADPTPVRTEVMVGSAEHGYAGRYDLEIELTATKTLRKTNVRKWHDVGPGVFLTDCKSAKDVYPDTNFRQLAAYEAARLECGYPPTDGQYILNVDGGGSYKFVKSTATLSDFLAVLSVYRSNDNLKVAA